MEKRNKEIGLILVGRRSFRRIKQFNIYFFSGYNPEGFNLEEQAILGNAIFE